ncbi:hypothetical protein [Paenibacillus jiagnxiensis]|uniref:hypothetical protein n=1 Tax=Paenibacillus jiagnxiensis TaxID=3228926 RepID=UPI0033B85181
MNDKLSLQDDDREWRQFIQFELSKLQPNNEDSSKGRRVVPEALQFAFRHAASYLMAQLKKKNHSNNDLELEEPEEEEEEAAENDNLDAEEKDSNAEPLNSNLAEEVESPETEPAIDDEEQWRQFIQEELGKYQSGEADKSPIDAITSTLLPFAFRHLASYLIERVKKAAEQKGATSDFAPERTPNHPESRPSNEEDGLEKDRETRKPVTPNKEEVPAVPSETEQKLDDHLPHPYNDKAELKENANVWKEEPAGSIDPIVSEKTGEQGAPAVDSVFEQVPPHTVQAVGILNLVPTQNTIPPQESEKLPVGTITLKSPPVPFDPLVRSINTQQKQTEQGNESAQPTHTKESNEQLFQEKEKTAAARGAIRAPGSRTSKSSSRRKSRNKGFSSKRSLTRKLRRKARSPKMAKLRTKKTGLRRLRAARRVRKFVTGTRQRKKIKVGKINRIG